MSFKIQLSEDSEGKPIFHTSAKGRVQHYKTIEKAEAKLQKLGIDAKVVESAKHAPQLTRSAKHNNSKKSPESSSRKSVGSKKSKTKESAKNQEGASHV